MIETNENKVYSFAGYELSPFKRTLVKDGELVRLNSKTFDLLLTFVENRGAVLSKDELLKRVWANQFVEENNLTVHISALRKALGEKKNENRFIVTIPGCGYSFVADVDEPVENEIIIEKHSFSRIVIEESEEDFSDFPRLENQIGRKPEAIGAGEKAAPKKKRDLKSRAILLICGCALLVSTLAVSFWAGGGFSTERRETDYSELKLNRLTASGRILNIAVSPDDKFVVFSQKEEDGQSLWLRQIETGSQTRILESKPVDYIGLSVTPDGNYVYGTTFVANKADPVVSKIPVLGGAVQELPFWTCIAVSFSPDGERIAFNQPRSSLKETHLITANADGSDFKILKRLPEAEGSFPNYKTNSVAWSPDGSQIAAIFEETGENGKTARLVGFDPNNGGEISLSDKRWAFAWHLSWTSDGKNLAVVGLERDAAVSQIWIVSPRTGEARQITNDLHDYSFVAASKKNETIFAVKRNVRSSLQIADFTENSEKLEPREIFTESKEIDNVAWSPSGEIFFTSAASGKSEIWRVNPNGGEPEQLTVDSGATFGISISPDGQRIAFNSWRGNEMSIRVADADGKNARPLTNGGEDVSPRFAGNDRIVFQNGLNNKNITLWRVGLNGEPPVQLTQTHATHPQVSPDGSTVAYYFMDAENQRQKMWRIGLISAENGEFQGKLNFPKFVTERRMAWHPNNRFIAQIFYEGDNINLLLLPIDGGEGRTMTNLGKGEIGSVAFAPDGRRLVYSRHAEARDIVSLQILP